VIDDAPTQTTGFASEKAILDEALAIMARKLGRPMRFASVLDPGTSSIQVIFRPPGSKGDRGYIGAGLSCGPLPGETHERHSDLADGNFDQATLGRVLRDIQEEFDAMVSGT